MSGYLIKFYLLAIFAIPVQVLSQDNHCPELLKNEHDLDMVYNLSSLVFIARINPRNKINQQIFNFHRFDPVLKGDVPKDGFITFSASCYPRVEDSIYLFMLNSLDEKVAGFNAIFFSLPDDGPGFRWIADWVEAKVAGQLTAD